MNNSDGCIVFPMNIWEDKDVIKDKIFEKEQIDDADDENKRQEIDVDLKIVCFSEIFNHSKTG